MASSAAGSSPVPASLAPFHDFGGSKGRGHDPRSKPSFGFVLLGSRTSLLPFLLGFCLAVVSYSSHDVTLLEIWLHVFGSSIYL
jgi:hypothetical protein